MSDKITGCKPTVNEAHEFLQIAENFKKPLEIIREALSNSWDANASKIRIDIQRDIPCGGGTWSPIIEFTDDGNGMRLDKLQNFFSLGYSNKPERSIGSKGHGTKIYYKSDGIKVETIARENGKKLLAETEKPPYGLLKQGKMPTYEHQTEDDLPEKHGTKIKIHRFYARPRDFQEIRDEIIPYIKWYTIGGSFEHYFDPKAKKMDITLANWKYGDVNINNWFEFPKENLTAKESSKLCKIFHEEILEGETTENHIAVTVQIIGCLVGEEMRKKIVADRYNMGVWLAKDFIKIEKDLPLTRKLEVAGKPGEYYYNNFLILANCQQFNLPANREDIKADEIYDSVTEIIKRYIKKIGNDPFTIKFFGMKKEEAAVERAISKEQKIKEIDKRMEDYKGRQSLPKRANLKGAIIKVPKNEKETLLLLQAMISNDYKGIDFVIGEYGDYTGPDSIIEFDDKGTHRVGWLELIHKLSDINTWYHFHDRIHKIVCWDIGKISPGIHQIVTRKTFEYIQKDGAHFIKYDGDFIKVYVLKEILEIN